MPKSYITMSLKHFSWNLLLSWLHWKSDSQYIVKNKIFNVFTFCKILKRYSNICDFLMIIKWFKFTKKKKNSPYIFIWIDFIKFAKRFNKECKVYWFFVNFILPLLWLCHVCIIVKTITGIHAHFLNQNKKTKKKAKNNTAILSY